MHRGRLASIPTICLVLFFSLRAARGEEAERSGQDYSCVNAVQAIVRCSNPEEVCQRMLGGLDAYAGSTFSQLFESRSQDLGDGTEAYVFAQRPGSDPYAYVPSFHFVREGERLAILFDGQGRPSSYATGRPKVNGRYQIERTSTADIPGLYRKREVETWFWTGKEYARAFSKVTMDGSPDPKLNGTQILWSPDTQDLYQRSGASWTYRVQSGDTLSGIAKKLGVSVDEILRQNDIRNAQSLRLGQLLRYEEWKVNAR